jgi:hypothetical protein
MGIFVFVSRNNFTRILTLLPRFRIFLVAECTVLEIASTFHAIGTVYLSELERQQQYCLRNLQIACKAVQVAISLENFKPNLIWCDKSGETKIILCGKSDVNPV